MNIDGIKGAGAQSGGQKPESAEAPARASVNESTHAAEPARQAPDRVELSAAAIPKATYKRDELGVQSEPLDETRADKLAAILSRVKDGYYDSRDVYEQVANKLMAEWQIGSSRDAYKTDL